MCTGVITHERPPQCGAAGLAPAAAECRRPSGLVEIRSSADFVLFFDFVISEGRDPVCIAFLIVGDTAPAEPGEVITEWSKKIVRAAIGQVGGKVTAEIGRAHV